MSPVSTRALRLPTLASAGLRVRNRLHLRRHPWWVPWQGRPLAWSFTSAWAAGVGRSWQIELDWDGATVRLILPGTTPQRLLTLVWPDDPWPSEASWPPVLWQALFEVLTASWRRTHPTLRPARVRVTSVREEPPGPAHTLLGWSLSGDMDLVEGLIALDATAAARLSELLQSAPVRSAGSWSGLSMPVRLLAGWTDLSASELSATRPGDVLLMDTTHLDADRQGICLSLGGGLGVHARRQADRWLIDQGVNSVMSEPEVFAQPASADLVRLDDIPVRLTFDLGDREVSLGELQALLPGYVFHLGRELPACVCIRANGRPIGEGDLVDIDGRIGVVVLRLLGADAA
nr:type III secretion system cytoplasmic ring protein SctQ [uncultured Hydrogenophaga sp.]